MKARRGMIMGWLGVLWLALLPAAAATAATVQEAVRGYVETHMAWDPDTVRLEFPAADSAPLERGVTLRVENSGSADLIGDTVFMVRHYQGARLLRTEAVRVRIEVMRPVVVAARPLAAGTVLAEGDLQVARRWVRRLQAQTVASPDEALGKRLTIQVAAGAELQASQLKEVPLVRRGKMVKVVLERGAMRIATVGLPEEDGTAGSIVRVRNVTSNKIMYARVLSESLVGIEF